MGGRWDGALNGRSALRYSDDPVAFRAGLDSVKESRRTTMRDIISQLTGRQIAADEVEDPFGLGIPDRAGAARRISESNAKMHAEFEDFLGAHDPLAWAENGDRFSLLGHYLWKLGKLVANYYATDSHYYDGEAMDASFRYLRSGRPHHHPGRCPV
jgi:hypothetical protein